MLSERIPQENFVEFRVYFIVNSFKCVLAKSALGEISIIIFVEFEIFSSEFFYLLIFELKFLKYFVEFF